MRGLKTCTARRSMTARFTRRMSSSLFPLNMLPTTTSNPAWVEETPLTRGARERAAQLTALGGLRGRGRRVGLRVSLVEAIDAALDIEEVLLAREERVALRAHLDVQLGLRRTGRERVAAGALDLRLDVRGVDLLFHGLLPRSLKPSLSLGCRTRSSRVNRSSHASSSCLRDDRHPAAIVARGTVPHLARDEREEGVVLADADVLAGEQLRPALPDEHRARLDADARVLLHAEALPGGIATVAGRARTFLMCHVLTSGPRSS